MRMFTPERIFLLLGALFGLIYVFLTPPFQSPDEDIHFMSAWQYGTFDQLGGFPKNLVDALYEHLDVAIDKTGERKYTPELRHKFAEANCPSEPEKIIEYDTTLVPGLYSQYLIQMAAFKAAQLFTGKYLYWLWAGRLANLGLFLLLGYYAVKLAVFFRWGMVLLALTPMSLSLASSLSYDVSTNAAALLTFSLLQRLIVRPEKLKFKDFIPLLALGLLFVFLKFPYILIFAVLMFLPGDRFAVRKTRWLVNAVLVLLFAGAVFVNMRRAEDINRVRPADARPFYDRDARMRITRANPAEQIVQLKKNPGEFAVAYGKTLASSIRMPFYAGSFIGILGWLTVWPPLWMLALYGVILLLATQVEGDKSLRFTPRMRLWFVLIGIGIFTLIHLIFYMAVATEKGEIAGVQGKYFFPIAMLFLLPLAGSKLFDKMPEKLKKSLPIFFTAFIVTMHIVVLVCLHNHFYK